MAYNISISHSKKKKNIRNITGEKQENKEKIILIREGGDEVPLYVNWSEIWRQITVI